ncbi:head-tail connector protein [Marinobacterium lutimaris]|uniref:Phage gp6-like head-tail connector protein n=1 Tax=Marinobacterium lutimaris TaxID=568106 RepID=A0A1H5Y922_9GAMM|nr:head-tail connector protein [Marinobacterium lutimaris]SEG20468.1 phage conserved hypothetical protein, phiE125 gp8 family [Marinobacterium lutimaris]
MITKAEARLHCRAETFAEEDALFDALIAAAYKTAENMTGRSFVDRTETLVLDGFPASTLYVTTLASCFPKSIKGLSNTVELPWTPVQSVDSVEYVDPEGETQTLNAPPLRLDTRPLYPTLAPQWGTEWPDTIDEPESVTITATVGYADEDLPPDVRCALLLIIGHLYANRESVVIGTISSELPMGVHALLDPYKIHRIG